MVTRTTGTAAAVRIMRIVIATISSMTVKPLPLQTRNIGLFSVHRYNRLRTACWNALHACVLQRSAIDTQRGLTRRLCLEGERKHLPIAGNTGAARRSG